MDKNDKLTEKMDELRNELNIPAFIKEYGIDEAVFLDQVDMLTE